MCPVVKFGRRGVVAGEVTYMCPVVKIGTVVEERWWRGSDVHMSCS